MAGIDYSIPGQFKGIQLESPINQMARAMELRNLQETSQINALKQQEYQQDVAEKNELAKIYANPNLKYGSEAFFAEVSKRAPRYFEKIATGEAQRQTALSTQQQREAATEKTRLDVEQTRKKEERDAIDLRLKQFNDQFPAYNIQSEQDVEDRIVAMANDEMLGPLSTRFGTLGDTIARNKAEFRRDPRNYIARTSGVSAEKIFQAVEEKENADFSQDQLNRVINKQPLISIEEWRNTRGQPQAAPASAATTSTSADVAMPTEGVTITPDGKKQLPGTSFKGDVGGVDFLDPTAQALYTLASDPRNKDRAPALRDMADKIQAEHVKRLEENRKRDQLTGGFLNVVNARKQIAELKKNPTSLNLAIIKDLEQQIKAENEGRAPKFSLGGITLSTEKKFGEAFAGKIADSDVKLRDAAEVAPEAATTANRVLSILQSGQVFTGSAANIKLQMAKFLKLGGGSDSEAIANTEVLISSLADTTLGAIRSSGLGSGQGFTDKDREFLERAKAGQITYDAKSLKDLAELAHKAAMATANKWNKRVQSIPKSAIEGTGISTEPVTVPSMLKSGPRDKTPATNSKGWKLEVDASGNRAYVSPDRKQFEEVK
jgi:hypothetical protein